MALTTIYQLKTFADLVNAVREELKIQSADALTINRIKRDINMVYTDEVVPFSNFKWLRGNITLKAFAAIQTGTASVVLNSNSVTLTQAPGGSKKGFYFSSTGYNEIYRITEHTANSTVIKLEVPYTGPTVSAASYKIWTDAIPLPAFARETFEVTHDFLDQPLTNCGLQKFRQYVASVPKVEGRPQFYTTDTYSDPGQFAAISGLPAISTRASSQLTKTLVFASDVSGILQQGDRILISAAGDFTYNGAVEIASVSTTTVTYTGLYQLYETPAADLTMIVQKLQNPADSRRYKELRIYPSIFNQDTQLHVDFLREVVPMAEDTDEPLVPISDRIVLLYGALQRGWSRERNPAEAARNQALYTAKLGRMAGKVDDSIDQPTLRPSSVYLGAKRSNNRQYNDGRRYFPSSGGGSSSGGQSILGNPNAAAEFDGTGTLLGGVVTTTELHRLSGILSKADGISDTNALTNKTINASLNTITNITNVSIASGAAIAYSKLNLTASIVNADINASAAIAYSKLSLTGSILNADISASAAIAYSKLNLTGAILNADINASAAIAFSKLASLTSAHILVGSAGNVATDVAVTGDVTITNAGVTAIGANKVANSQLAQMAASTIKGNNTGGIANALDLTVSQAVTLLARQVVVGSAQTSTGTVTSNTFAAFTNAPSVSITPTVTGTYLVFGSFTIACNTIETGGVEIQITATVGSPTTVFNQAVDVGPPSANRNISVTPYAVFTLTAATSYTFTVFGKAPGADVLSLSNSATTAGTVLVVTQLS